MDVRVEIPKVSVLCVAYNHEKFIRQALDGFVMQKTTFLFEVLVHDDASADGTAGIIMEYAERYPEIIKPILQKENQHSKGVFIVADILLPMAQGKYVALCEGDDYWCDENKLQQQFDYMENHEKCSLCVHNTKIHYLDGSNKDILFHKWTTIHSLTEQEVFFGWNVHTSSYFIKKEYAERPLFSKIWAGDYAVLTLAYDKGTIVSLPYVMSVYNANNPAGVTYKNNNSGVEVCVAKQKSRLTYLQAYDEYTQGRHKQIVEDRIREIMFECERTLADDILKSNKDYKKVRNTAKKLCSNGYFNDYLKRGTLKQRIKGYIKYKGYVCGYLWFLAILTYQKW